MLRPYKRRVGQKRGAGRGPPLQMKWRELFGGGGVIVASAGVRRSDGSSAAGGFLLLFASLLDERFAGEADLVALDGKHFDEDLVAEFQFIANVADAVLGDFADVQEAVGAGEELDERAEFRKADDFAEIGLADFGAGGDVADHL